MVDMLRNDDDTDPLFSQAATIGRRTYRHV
jgi:hypothetical protein